MPADIQKIMQNKELIINSILSRGPSLPIHVARSVNLSTLFASAYLSELYAENRVKMSHMRVGSSPLYYLSGQEAQLENFIEYLNHKEKEAFFSLKKEKILQDKLQEPAIRVALRQIKDFAQPFKVSHNNEEKLFWKYYLAKDEESQLLMKNILEPKKEKHHKKQEQLSPATTSLSLASAPAPASAPQVISSPIQNALTDNNEKPKKPSKKKTFVESKFANNIKEYLKAKHIEILEIKEEAKKNFSAKVRIDTLFGKQEYLLIARDKKKLKEEDLIHALHKAQSEKMPALLMSPGEIDKKSLDLSKDWRNLLRFEKVKF